jgi:AcrR family transcriptional regulator
VAVTDATFAARSDARRNRERLVSAARELFASEGLDVPAREVARTAGVGVATLYRHFPARNNLVDAVLEDACDEMVGIAEAALAEGDPWRGFTRYVEDALVLYGRNRGLKDAAEARTQGERIQTMRARIQPLTKRIVGRAHDAGVLRRDFGVQDIGLILSASDRVAELAAPGGPQISRRYLGFVLDGLRATG